MRRASYLGRNVIIALRLLVLRIVNHGLVHPILREMGATRDSRQGNARAIRGGPASGFVSLGSSMVGFGKSHSSTKLPLALDFMSKNTCGTEAEPECLEQQRLLLSVHELVRICEKLVEEWRAASANQIAHSGRGGERG